MRLQTQVTMTMRELDRLKVIQAVVDRELRATPAAERLQMSVRQIRRLADRYRREGPMGLVSGHRNRPSNNRLEADLESQVAQILRDHYPDFGPTLRWRSWLSGISLCWPRRQYGGFRSPLGCESHAS